MAVDLNVSPNRTAVRFPKKVKLLCSYGGRILPRSGDGDLRYAGGHTRIISVPPDVSFDDLIFKISSAAAARAPVSLKYQLPDEDLETLISVSCPEDLEVMMEEYEKLAADGSQKLRTFLFSADLSDARQSYIEAVNSVAVQREESTISGIGGTSDSSLFSNDDPWKVIGGTHLLPPRPIKMADELDPEDSGIDEFPLNRMNSDIIALLEEGKFNPQLDLLRKDFSQEPSPPIEGLGVPASILQSSISPFSILSAYEMKENPQFVEERGNVDSDADSMEIAEQQIEDVPLDDINMNLQVMEAIGHLQIIRSYDLEELRELGSGTFGTVYHGKWRGSDVAIKRVRNRCFAGKLSEQERMKADFWNEARKLAQLHHPNVLAFYGIVLDGPGGSVATVTEYMVNGSLMNALQRNESNDKAFGWRKRLLVAKDVAFGMEYLHGKNIVHFDLKSDNLLVNLRDPQRPICKVGDLGLSKVKRHTLISGGVRGTLPWMAPELLNGCSNFVSEKVDVFSFGIVMWELLTGEEPYEDLHYGAIIGGIVSNTLRPPVPEWCDPQWRSLMERCWSAEPSDRPSFTEISATLRVVARAVSTPHRKGSP